MTNVTVKLKDGRTFVGPIWEYRPKEGWFSLVLDPLAYPDGFPERFLFEDCESAVNKNVLVSYNRIADVNLLCAWARNNCEPCRVDKGNRCLSCQALFGKP